MQKAFPIDKTVEFLSRLKADAGKIKSRKLEKMKAGYAEYKTEFDRGIYLVNFATANNEKITGFFIKPFKETAPVMARNVTPIHLPFTGEWTITWGGDTKEQNYHVESLAQKNAFDFIITDSSGKRYRGNGARNEDYYAYGKSLIAPCDGEVVLVVDGVKDNIPGTLNPVYVPGNTVIIKTPENEYLFFAHFKQHTIKVKQGDKIRKGRLLGLCGNSGNSSEPHLHFHIQNIEDMNAATGIKCYFTQFFINGKQVNDYSPVKGEKVSAN